MSFERMSREQFEEFMKNSIINSYKKVFGEDKWNSATPEEKNYVLHMMVQEIGRNL